MPLVVNSNIASLNAQRQLLSSGAELDKASERLASGKRINSAADDAAGLAISNRQTSQIRGLDQAVRNANDGISLIQTAEGALDETTNILQRMRELSIQSANGIYSDTDRATLNAEVQQLKAEVDRIAETTSFNGQNILDGSLGEVALQVGSEANQTVDFSVGGFSANSLGGSGGDVIGEALANGLTDLTGFTASGSITVNDTALSVVTAGSSLNDILATYNSDLDDSGIEVSALVSAEANNAGDGQLVAGTDTLALAVVDGDGNTTTYTITGTSSMDELVDKINSETAISASLTDTGKLVLAQEGIVSIDVTDSTGTDAAGFDAGQADEQTRLVFTDASSGNGVKIEGVTTSGATAAEILAVGINFQDDDANTLGESLTRGGIPGNDINAGDLVINGVEIGAIEAGTGYAESIDAVVEAINDLSAETGVIAYENTANQLALRATDGGTISVAYGENATDANVLDITGLQEQNATAGAGSVSGIDISTAAGAQRAIDVVDAALEQINETRSELGAVNNRLDFTVSNLSNVSEKASAARSRIVDTDFAAETAQLSRSQVLQQASQAMLAQANARPQQVLSLLQ